MARAVAVLAAPAFVIAVFVAGATGACSSTAALAAKGQACELASDCEEGLICIPSGTGRVCSNDLAAIQKTESTPPTDAAADAPPNVYDAPYDIEDAPYETTDSAPGSPGTTTTDAASTNDAASSGTTGTTGTMGIADAAHD